MPRALAKVYKQISKKRGGSKGDALHEKSRDAKRLRRASGREDKLARTTATTVKARQAYIDRVSYFQQAAGEQTDTLPDDQVAQLITQYISRHAEELAQLRADRRNRKGDRPPTKREDTLAQREEGENKEFVTGFWTPDIGDEENVGRLRAWNGDWSSLSTVSFCRVSRGGEKKESRFPPMGMS